MASTSLITYFTNLNYIDKIKEVKYTHKIVIQNTKLTA